MLPVVKPLLDTTMLFVPCPDTTLNPEGNVQKYPVPPTDGVVVYAAVVNSHTEVGPVITFGAFGALPYTVNVFAAPDTAPQALLRTTEIFPFTKPRMAI